LDSRPFLACLGSGDIVERAVLAPNEDARRPFRTGICARNDDRRRELSRRYASADLGHEIGAVLSDPSVDAVYIALPNRCHAQLAQQAAAAGKTVFVEKPACIDAQGLQGLTAARAAGGRIAETLMTAGAPWTLRVQALKQDGGLGTLLKVNTKVHLNLAAERRVGMVGTGAGGGAYFDLAAYWVHLLNVLALVSPAITTLTTQADPLSRRGERRDLRCRIEFACGDVRGCASFSHGDPYAARHELVFECGRIVVKDFLRSRLGAFPVRLAVTGPHGEQTLEHAGGAHSDYAAQLARMRGALDHAGPIDPALLSRSAALVASGASVMRSLSAGFDTSRRSLSE
jgi:predicted dehydrogenase